MKKVTLYVSLGFLSLFVYSSIVYPILEDHTGLPEIPGGVGTKTIFMLLFSVSHSWYLLGWRRTLVFFAMAGAISWGYEQLGVETGLVYGNYHYTDYLGAKAGHVPIIIPLAWFMMIYPSYVVANLIYSGRPLLQTSKMASIVLISLLSAAIMTAWDFVIDPYLSGHTVSAWVWEDGGAYFGIPVHNFFGWILTTFTIYFAFRVFERNCKASDSFPRHVAILPVAGYGLMLVANLIPREPPELIFIGPIVMGIPIALALARLRQNRILPTVQSN